MTSTFPGPLTVSSLPAGLGFIRRTEALRIFKNVAPSVRSYTVEEVKSSWSRASQQTDHTLLALQSV